MKVYHKTPGALEILDIGFKDAGTEHRGVWVADVPVDADGGGSGEYVLVIEVPAEILNPYLFTADPRDYQVFVVPAELLNRYPVVGCFCMNDEDHIIKQLANPSVLKFSVLDLLVARGVVVQCTMLSKKLQNVIEIRDPPPLQGAQPAEMAKTLHQDLSGLLDRFDCLIEDNE